MLFILSLSFAVHAFTLPFHIMRAKTVFQIWALRRTISAKFCFGHCGSSDDRYWSLEDYYDANGIVLRGSLWEFAFYGAMAACIAGIPFLGLSGHKVDIWIVLDTPFLAYGLSLLTLILLNRIAYLLYCSYSETATSATIEAIIIWLLHTFVSALTVSPATYHLVFATFILTECICVFVLFVGFCVIRQKRWHYTPEDLDVNLQSDECVRDR